MKRFTLTCQGIARRHHWCKDSDSSSSTSTPTKMDAQERILMSLVQGQEGKAWAMDLKGWKENDVFVCQWDYIVCDVYQTTVIGINMSEADFIGTLPSELGKLMTLEEISMRRNLVVGSIPNEIGNLPHLETLVLAENRLTGTVPNFASYKLKTLDLGYNLLSGTLSPTFGKTNPQLAELDLASNNIKGTLPTSFEMSDNILTISLSDNAFSGTIHEYLGNTPSINYLYLDGNSLMGTIPSTFSGKSSSMQELWLQNNLLTGTIPSEIGEIADLFNFYVDGNKFTGTIPQSLCRSSMNEDFFANVPSSQNRDYCDSVACPAGKVSFEGVFPCEDCQDSYFNPYLGRVDQCIDLKEIDILDIFYEATGGDDWTDVSWQIQDKLYCELEGITCGNHGNIIALRLKGKGLRGTIPEEIGFLRYLEQLDLSDNYLTGYLPSDLRWAPLQFLDVSGNRIKGIIPHTLCTKGGINGNGKNGNFDCDLVQCPPNYYSPIGRATEEHNCRPCYHGRGTPFIGSRKCSSLFAHLHPSDMDLGGFGFGNFLFIFFFMAFVFGMFYMADKGVNHEKVPTTDDDDENELRINTSVVFT